MKLERTIWRLGAVLAVFAFLAVAWSAPRLRLPAVVVVSNPPPAYHVTVQCDAVAGATQYVLYAGTNGVDWPRTQASAVPSVVISNLPENNFFRWTAVDAFGIESEPSAYWRKTNHFSVLWASNLAGPWQPGGSEMDDGGTLFVKGMKTNNWDQFKRSDR